MSIYILFQNAEDCYMKFCFTLHTTALFIRMCYLSEAVYIQLENIKCLAILLFAFILDIIENLIPNILTNKHGIVILKISSFNMEDTRN